MEKSGANNTTINKKRGLTIKQENFARFFVQGGNLSQAYRESYNTEKMSQKSIGIEACRLSKNPCVSLEILRLREQLRSMTLVTKESITKELEEVREKAVQGGDYSPAVTAIMGKAKVNGLLIEKNEHSGVNGGAIKVENLTIKRVIVDPNIDNRDT